MSVVISQFMKNIQKSVYGTVRFTVPAAWCLTVVRMRTWEAAREAATEREHCRSRSADPGVLVEGSFFFFTPRVLCLKPVYHILECDKA
jgi:hypothetical protein